MSPADRDDSVDHECHRWAETSFPGVRSVRINGGSESSVRRLLARSAKPAPITMPGTSHRQPANAYHAVSVAIRSTTTPTQ